jgi:hypothetical protein
VRAVLIGDRYRIAVHPLIPTSRRSRTWQLGSSTRTRLGVRGYLRQRHAARLGGRGGESGRATAYSTLGRVAGDTRLVSRGWAVAQAVHRAPAAMYELVIFGCDGVLVDSEAISNDVLARMLTRERLATTLREARRDYQGMLLTRHWPPGRGEARSAVATWLARRVRARAFRQGLEPVAGAAEVVRCVKAAA